MLLEEPAFRAAGAKYLDFHDNLRYVNYISHRYYQMPTSVKKDRHYRLLFIETQAGRRLARRIAWWYHGIDTMDEIENAIAGEGVQDALSFPAIGYQANVAKDSQML